MCEEMARVQAESVKPQENIVIPKVPDTPKNRKQSIEVIYDNKDNTSQTKYVVNLSDEEQDKRVIYEESDGDDLENSSKKSSIHNTPIDVDQTEGKLNNEDTPVVPFKLEEKQNSLASDESPESNEVSETLNTNDSPILINEKDTAKAVNINEDHFSEDYKMEAKKTTDSDQ